ESARKLKAVLTRNRPGQPQGSYSLLEFASGYGMVTRHLAHELAGADIVSCDIHDQAVDFISNTLHSPAVASRHVPMKPQERPEAMPSRIHHCHRGLSRVASAKPGSRAAITTPGSDWARSCSGRLHRA